MQRSLQGLPIRIPLAAVWLYQALWCKLLAHAPHQGSIVAGVPGLNPSFVLPAIGAAECVLAAWVLSGQRARAAAMTQTALLTAMNVCGIVWAGRMMADPAGMVLQNLAFLTLAWVAAKEPNANAA
jgi:hypothetical protein